MTENYLPPTKAKQAEWEGDVAEQHAAPVDVLCSLGFPADLAARLADALERGRYLVLVASLDGDELSRYWKTVDFPRADLAAIGAWAQATLQEESAVLPATPLRRAQVRGGSAYELPFVVGPALDPPQVVTGGEAPLRSQPPIVECDDRTTDPPEGYDLSE